MSKLDRVSFIADRIIGRKVPYLMNSLANNQNEQEFISHESGLQLPTVRYEPREDAKLHSNGVTIKNAATMFYGGAKSGKTRTIIKAFKGCEYFFLDFDRNYKQTIDEIEANGATYLNGDVAFSILEQLMTGKINNVVVVIDALGSVVHRLCNHYIKEHIESGKCKDKALELKEIQQKIGKEHSATVTFFNLVIEPMTKNSNSINFVHHTTQNMYGEKMEGNKGAWLSVFDFTYAMNRESRTFRLEAGRLPIAVNTIGEDNTYDRINKCIQENAEWVDVKGTQMFLVRYRTLSDNKAFRPVLNQLIKENKLQKIKVSSTEYLDANFKITAAGQLNI